MSLLALPFTYTQLYTKCWCPLILCLLVVNIVVNSLSFNHEVHDEVAIFRTHGPGEVSGLIRRRRVQTHTNPTTVCSVPT